MDSRLAENRTNYGAEGLIYKAREHVMSTDRKRAGDIMFLLLQLNPFNVTTL